MPGPADLDGARPLAFAGVDVFDGTSFQTGWTVVVQQGRILAAGTEPAPPGCRAVAGEGRTLLPGFIDCHVHLGLLKPRWVLAGGITTARDLGWPAERIFALVGQLDQDPAAGPRLLAAGAMLTAPGGYPVGAGWGPEGTGREVASPGEAADAVRQLAGLGAAVIKVAQEPRSGPTMPEPVLAAVVAEAHQQGLAVTSHLGSLAQLDLALAVGVDELAHGLWSDEPIPSAMVARMVAAGMVVVPTLHIAPSPDRMANLRRFLGAGGRVVYGTDMGNSGPPQGIDPMELELMMAAGMTVTEVLAAATSGAADHVGLRAKGRVVPGAVADLVLVAGDPRADLGVLREPAMVLREGAVCR